MESEPDPELKQELFVSNEDSPIQFADNFKVRWVVQCNLLFNNFEHLPPNPMNESLPIKQSKNGQELPFKLGNYLCYLIYHSTDPKTMTHLDPTFPTTKVLVSLESINNEFKVK